jgi:hypothetical protein
VDIDNVHAADAMTTHLISIGRRRIGHVAGMRRTVAAEDRVAGYGRAMQRAALPFEDLVVDGDFNAPSGAAGAAELLDRGVDAIFCANDSMAQGALGAITARGLRVPDDVALGGFDDLEFSTRLDPADDRPPGRAGAGRGGGQLPDPAHRRPGRHAPACPAPDRARHSPIDSGRWDTQLTTIGPPRGREAATTTQAGGVTRMAHTKRIAALLAIASIVVGACGSTASTSAPTTGTASQAPAATAEATPAPSTGGAVEDYPRAETLYTTGTMGAAVRGELQPARPEPRDGHRRLRL